MLAKTCLPSTLETDHCSRIVYEVTQRPLMVCYSLFLPRSTMEKILAYMGPTVSCHDYADYVLIICLNAESMAAQEAD